MIISLNRGQKEEMDSALGNYIMIIGCIFYVSLILFLIYPFVVRNLWDIDNSIEENIKRLKSKLIIWGGFLAVSLIMLFLMVVL